ncbi:hypothetical protein AVEN_57168-1 [Araneus ventricosus]|uniref:Uncharacterized protein n=1 Tax=Araneus ventricosus TaxID=182803 RepID=A0A4Y2HFW7_ARAVE|nr:hypothetical protein AVEN_57168-1 [Araneus ventricosus]
MSLIIFIHSALQLWDRPRNFESDQVRRTASEPELSSPSLHTLPVGRIKTLDAHLYSRTLMESDFERGKFLFRNRNLTIRQPQPQ